MGGISLLDASEIYRRDFIVYRNQSKKTEEMHLTCMNSLAAFLGNIPLESLTFQHIRDWKEDLEKSKSHNTVRVYILKLRVVLAFMRKLGHNAIDPEVVGVPRRKTTTVTFITEEEVEQLIDATFEAHSGYSTHNRYRNRALISLLYASGVRVSELCRLNRDDIQKDGTFTVVGKKDKARLCFLDERTVEYLEEYLQLRSDHHSALFLSDLTSERVSVATVQGIFKVARVKAGFKKPVHPHTMRHSFATNLLRNNTNLVYVKEFLGHASVQTTEMYTHVVNEDLKRIYKEKHTV